MERTGAGILDLRREQRLVVVAPGYSIPAGMAERPTAVAVDFDGCLVTNKWPEMGEPNQTLIESLIVLRYYGAQLILWTNREGELLDQAVAFCKEQGLEFDAVNDNLPSWQAMFGNNTRKVGADYYLDDKAVRVRAEG